MVDELEEHLKAVHDKYGKNIWLTEFALLGFSQVPLAACSTSTGTIVATQSANFTYLSVNCTGLSSVAQYIIKPDKRTLHSASGCKQTIRSTFQHEAASKSFH